MKILIMALNHSPELTGVGKYVGEMVEWLAQTGFEVRVVSAPPYYPEWRVAAGYSAGRYRRETDAGVRVYRCPVYVPVRPTGARRLLHLASFACSSFPVLLWQSLVWRPDIILVVEPPLVCAPAAWLCARLAGARAWLHVQDFEVDAAFELGLLRSAGARRFATVLERWLMRRFDRVSTISGRMLERLATKGVAPSRRYLFPNWVDLSVIRPLAAEGALRAELGLPAAASIALYSGNLGQKQGLEVIVEAARLLARGPGAVDVLFLICGAGSALDDLRVAAADLPNVRFVPLQPAERLNELLNLAAVHLLPQKANAEDLVMPSKLAGMLASGRPVIATARLESEVGRLLEGAGLVVPPGDAGGLAAAVAALAADPARSARLGAAGRAVALETCDRDAILARVFAAESIAALAGSA